MDKTGLCLVNSQTENAALFDFFAIKQYAETLQDVKKVWLLNEKDLKSNDIHAKQIKEEEINHLVIAGDSPGSVKSFFAEVMVRSGVNASIKLADFGAHAILNGKSTEFAKALIYSIVKGIEAESAFSPAENEVHPDTLIIGGGIAGIQAALEIANGGQKVYLLEKSGTIGGHMAMFDKTFPTLDCAACILTPKMVEIGQHSNIELITYAELKELKGEAGNFQATIHKKARRVNLSTCIGCGTCSEKCPRKAPSEFDANTSLRKAIYIPFPQAVPNKYLIDADNCTYVESGKCRVCEKVCPVPDCINLDEKDSEVTITVGNIIVATGFQVFNANKAAQFGYGKLPNVLTSLEFERLINAAGPTGGNITFRTQDKKGNWIFEHGSGEPRSVAIIHCVGSRDENFNKYCSKVCCMYSLKLAHLVKEKIHHADVFEYFIDMRAFGKGYEEFYERIKGEGVFIIRGRTAIVKQKGDKLVLRSEDLLNAKLIEQEVDMVILSVGLEAREESVNLAKMLGLAQTNEGWFRESDFIGDSVNTYSGGIAIAGVCQGPKDIPDTVAQASAAASRVLQSIAKGKVRKSINEMTLEQIEKRVNYLTGEVKNEK